MKALKILVLALCAISSHLFSTSTNTPLQECQKEAPTTIEKQAMHLIGIECRTSNAPGEGDVDIPALWARFQSESLFEEIPNKISENIYGLYCDYEGDHTEPYSLVIGCEVSTLDTIPAGMVAKTIPKSHYAVYETEGEFPKSLIDTWGQIWNSDLPRTYSGDLEVYGNKFNKNGEVDVLIAVKD